MCQEVLIEMPQEEKCYICLRITPEKILKHAHLLYNECYARNTLKDPESFDFDLIKKFVLKAREIGLKASKIMYDANKKNPIFFCGKREGPLLAGLFLLVGIANDAGWVRCVLADYFKTTDHSLTRSYVNWITHFSDLFPGFELRQEPYFNAATWNPITHLTYLGDRR